MLSFGSRQPAEPTLYTWLCKMKAMLVAKVTTGHFLFSFWKYRTTTSLSLSLKKLAHRASIGVWASVSRKKILKISLCISFFLPFRQYSALKWNPTHHLNVAANSISRKYFRFFEVKKTFTQTFWTLIWWSYCTNVQFASSKIDQDQNSKFKIFIRNPKIISVN